LYKESKWAKDILSEQKDDGSWGCFHTLSEPSKYPITTEQALRRLSILGYTLEDESIQKAVLYMNNCLTGKSQIPDRREKLHDWDIFTSLMLSSWIRRFTKDNQSANNTAKKWASVIKAAFTGNEYSQEEYSAAYHDILGMKPKGGRLINFTNFYPVSLTADMYDKNTEERVFDYILNQIDGIYYIYDEALSVLPCEFASKKASRYLGAVELLTAYKGNLHKLNFVYKWINSNKNEHDNWDMGSSIKDKIYFPLSDSWRLKESRVLDCTYRIKKLLSEMKSQ
jgi:hypothetical protein